MGIFDRAKDALNQHGDQVGPGLDKLAGLANERTGGKHGDAIEKGAQFVKEKLSDHQTKDNPPA